MDKDAIRPGPLARAPMPEPEALTWWSKAVADQIKNADQADAIRTYVKQVCAE